MTRNKKEEENTMPDKGGHLTRTGNINVVDITKSENTSKDILDITDTPDVAVWNKSVQIKSNAANIAKYSKERENVEAETIGIGLRKKRRKNDDDDKDSTIIDPTNQREMDDVVNSGGTLTDKA
jgi:hypothetical protein